MNVLTPTSDQARARLPLDIVDSSAPQDGLINRDRAQQSPGARTARGRDVEIA
jgi:hypothetical protein